MTENDIGSFTLSHRISDKYNGPISIAELRHNSLDAKATIFEITEFEHKNNVYFVIADNGEGVVDITNSISSGESICKTEGIGKYCKGL